MISAENHSKIMFNYCSALTATSKTLLQRQIVVIHQIPPFAMQLYLCSGKKSNFSTEGVFLPVNDRQVKTASPYCICFCVFFEPGQIKEYSQTAAE